MSSITSEWTVDRVRGAIAFLDIKTGLHGASLPIVLGNHAGALGCYQYIGEEKFWFRPSFINDPKTPEAAVINCIRHEYSHYIVQKADLGRFVGHSKHETSHGKDWKYACKLVGAIPKRCYNPADFREKNWSVEESDAYYRATDINECDIIAFINKWGQVPILDKEIASKMLERIRNSYPNVYYEIGDEVVHPVRGHGVVTDTIPCNYFTQKVFVKFEDLSEGVYTAKAICKVVDGEVIPFNDDERKNKSKSDIKLAQLSIEDTNQYHVLSRDFDIAELRILIDVVCSMKSLPHCKAKDLTKKLARLGGPSCDLLMETINIESIPRTDNSQIYYIIDAVLKAKTTNKQIAFKYYEYSTQVKKALKNGGKKYTVSPYQLVCTNEFYYLLGYSEKHKKITAFRVDRICGIPELVNEAGSSEPEEMNVEKYVSESNHMMSGDMVTVTLRFDRSVLDAIVDRFGQEMDLTFSTKNECIAKVDVALNNVFFAWVFGFDGKVMIAGPSNVQDQFIRLVSRMMARL